MLNADTKEKLESQINTLREELDRVHRESSEVDVLLRQANVDVDKLAQREVAVSNRVRDLEINLDKYGKAEIKNICAAAQEVQMRLQMMRSQQDQFQLKQNTLRSRKEQTSALITMIEEMLGLQTSNGEQMNGAGGDDDLVVNLIQSQEAERQRLSVQIHDALAQPMSNLVLRAQICERLVDHDIDRARAELSALKTATNTMLQDIRKCIFDLHPMVLQDLGLVATLRRFVTQFGETNKIEASLMVQDLDARLPLHYEVTIFRFVQEALNNIAKHSSANQAWVLLNASDSTLQVVIEDDGSGFQVEETINDKSGRRNMGIASMQQQAEKLLRGEFGIESALGRGTRVAATIPMP